MEFDFLPALALALQWISRGLGGWRYRIRHMASDLHSRLITIDTHLGIHVDFRVTTDSAQVHVAQMAQVKQVVMD